MAPISLAWADIQPVGFPVKNLIAPRSLGLRTDAFIFIIEIQDTGWPLAFPVKLPLSFRFFHGVIFILNLYRLTFLLSLVISPTWAYESALLDMDLEELMGVEVLTVSKTPEASSQSPAVVTVITAEDIARYGYESIADALRHAPHFVDNGDLAGHNFGVRGINAGARAGSRIVKFMIDHQPVAYRPSAQSFVDRELIPLALVERIEIVRGPGSVLYGADAFLGVVNVITRDGKHFAEQGQSFSLRQERVEQAGSGTEVSLAGGAEQGNWRVAGGMSGGERDLEGLSLPRRSPNYDWFADGVDGRSTLADQNLARPFSTYARAHYDGPHAITLSGYYQRLATDHPFSDVNALKSPQPSRIGLHNEFLRVDYRHAANPGLEIRAHAAWVGGGALDSDRIEVGADSFYLRRDRGYRGMDFGLEGLFRLREGQDTLLVGADYRRSRQDLETFTRVDRANGQATQLNPPSSEIFHDTGFYLQYAPRFTPKWNGIFGARLDHGSVTGDQPSFRAGVVGQLPANLVVKCLAGTSFQAPSSELLHRQAVQAGDIIGNPNLQAQKATTFELSLTAPIREILSLTTTLFRTRVKDLVVFESDYDNLFANNSTASTTTGLELEARLLWRGLDAYVNYSAQHTRRDANPQVLLDLEQRDQGELYPRHHANFGFHYTWRKLRLALNNRWMGRRPASTQNILIAQGAYHLDPYLDTTLTLSTDAFSLVSDKPGRLFLQIRDVFDSRYVNPGFGGIDFPSEGRRFVIGFEQRF